MQQDINVLESQEANRRRSDVKYLLLTESDRLIMEYRHVCKKWVAATTGGPGP